MRSSRLALLSAVAVVSVFTACGGAEPQGGADDSSGAKVTTHLTRVPASSALVTTAKVNLRSGGNSTDKILAVIPEGDDVTVTTGVATNSWFEVSYGSQKGWVYAPYLSPEACLQLDQAASHLKTALSACSASDDAQIYDFDRASCESAGAVCSQSEMKALLDLATCDEKAPVCQSAPDRDATVGAINACGNSVASVSSTCVSALSN